jgi:hypothetical protein
MPFTRRTTSVPTLEQLTELERTWIIDRTPETPSEGAGYGTLLCVGEFEDGDFNTPTEVYGDSDLQTRFGGFGYSYGSLIHQNPCARLHLTENWNGNAWMKLQGLKPPRRVVCRVDTSVGDARFTLAAALRSDPQTFAMVDGDQLSVTTDAGGPANSTALSAAVATITGGGFAASGYAGGEQIGITVDGLPEVIITFQVGDQTRAQVATRINGFMGYVCGSDTGAALKLDGTLAGTDGDITLRDVTDPAGSTTLIAIGHAAGSTAGTGNVGNVDAVTGAEMVTLIRSAAILAINGEAQVDAVTGEVVVYRTGSSSGTVQINDVVGTPATSMGFTTGTTITANVGDAFTVSAGTRVENAGGDQWVTMRTISWPEGTVAAPNIATQDVEVRPANDIGTLAGAGGGTVTTLVDLPSGRMVEVTNPSNLSAALTEAQIDAAYADAWDATLLTESDAEEVNVSICARRSDNVVRQGMQNAIDASNQGCYGRKFVTGSPLGLAAATGITNVASFRSDRVSYTHRGFLQTIPEIAKLGTAGGVGFTESGQITIRADGPLAYLKCALNPEENIGQSTTLLSYLDGLEVVTETYNEDLYVAFKAAGICAPRLEKGTLLFQSEVTTDLTPGRTTQKRRAFADYAQDSLALVLEPFSKKLASDARREGALVAQMNLLNSWKSEKDPENARIKDFTIYENTDNNVGWEASGVFGWKTRIQQFSSMDSFVLDTEVGEGVVIAREAA